MHCSSKGVSAFQCKIWGPNPDGIIEELTAFVLNGMFFLNFDFSNWSEIKKLFPDLNIYDYTLWTSIQRFVLEPLEKQSIFLSS